MWNYKIHEIYLLIYRQVSPCGNVKCHHILQFFKLIDGTHDPNGQLSFVISSAAFQKMNQEVHVTSESSNSKNKVHRMIIYVHWSLAKFWADDYMDRVTVLVFIHPACILLIVMICASMMKLANTLMYTALVVNLPPSQRTHMWYLSWKTFNCYSVLLYTYNVCSHCSHCSLSHWSIFISS